MSLFRREPEPQKSSPAPAPARPAARPAPSPPSPEPRAQGTTRIARGSKVVGQVSGSTELLVDGHVDGEIDLESRVVVGTKGIVEGRIQARTVEVGGKVLGNVHGIERVEVLTSGSLEGDVVAPRVVIAEGAFFKGKVEMVDEAAAAARAKSASGAKGDSSRAKPNAPNPSLAAPGGSSNKGPQPGPQQASGGKKN